MYAIYHQGIYIKALRYDKILIYSDFYPFNVLVYNKPNRYLETSITLTFLPIKYHLFYVILQIKEFSLSF